MRFRIPGRRTLVTALSALFLAAGGALAVPVTAAAAAPVLPPTVGVSVDAADLPGARVSVRTPKAGKAAPVAAPPRKDAAHTRGGSALSRFFTCPCYWYNVGEDDTNSNSTVPSGVIVNMTVETPTVDTGDGDYHSLGQIAVREITSGTHYVEVGWAVNPAVFGDTNPHLFASKWESGTWCGSYTGSGTCGGAFVDINAGDGLSLGMSLAAVSGTAKTFKVLYQSSTPAGGGWWVGYDNSWVGYFPKTGSGWPGTFDQARLVQVYGEVATDDDPIVGCTDMGSGTHGAGNPTPAGASMGSTTYYDASGAGLPSGDVNLNVFETPAYAGWTEAALSTRTFRYGGPGAC